ncbi:MAG TPA: hypothetical protein DCQ92_10330 [Verrucomicrobia subdivision 3 bacterium]|nr:hypothetical protein [Limisphaerales bacterium]
MSNAQFMRLALRFARRGYGATSRNPNAVASPSLPVAAITCFQKQPLLQTSLNGFNPFTATNASAGNLIQPLSELMKLFGC